MIILKKSTRLSDAIHIMAFIAVGGNNGNLSSTAIAFSLNKNPAQVRQIMSNLRKNSLITSIPGHVAPTIAKDPANITLREIYEAVDGKNLLYLNNDTNEDCRVGVEMTIILDEIYNNVQTAALKKLASYSLQDIIDKLNLQVIKKQGNN